MSQASLRIRTGNTIVLAMGVLALTGAMLVISAQSAVNGSITMRQANYQLEAKAAVEAVLSRQEIKVVDLAQAGDPLEFAKWDKSYGLDFFGNCEVRWRVEPVRTSTTNGLTTPIQFVTNPSPDQGWTPPTPAEGGPALSDNVTAAWKPNDSVYLFRASAEARYLSSDGADATQVYRAVAKAQGARYVAIFKEPLFRYVIFYAQEGPLGDLELSHGPAIRIMGNVHSNGSIYLGADTGGLSMSNATPTSGDTQIGVEPWSSTLTYQLGDRATYNGLNYQCTASGGSGTPAADTTHWAQVTRDLRVRVTGVEGIFRLAKPLMYGFMNGFPVDGTATAYPPSATNYNVGALTDATGLLPTANAFAPREGAGSTFDQMTYSGAVLNPYRVGAQSGLVTRPPGSGADTQRRINGKAIVGDFSSNNPDSGNDARDAKRSKDKRWIEASVKPPVDGFGGWVRTLTTGGGLKKLPLSMGNRTLEAQRLTYHKVENMGTAEATAFRDRGPLHDLATPNFIDVANTVEDAGQYVRYALGGDSNYMGRNYTTVGGDTTKLFTGWTIVDSTGAPVTSTSPSAGSGIIIRERPVPDFTYYGLNRATGAPAEPSASAYLPDRTLATSAFVPYAYGKHKDPAFWPFTEFWVGNTVNNGSAVTQATSPGFAAPSSNYIANSLTATTAPVQTFSQDPTVGGTLNLTAYVRGGGDTSYGTTDNIGFYRDNWRFIHLRRENSFISNQVGPKVITGDANAFFPSSTFQAVEGRLARNAGVLFSVGSNAYVGAAAGLMIRPATPNILGAGTVDLSAQALNSRDPYAAIVLTRTGGIQIQRRVRFSNTYTQPMNAWYKYYTGDSTDISTPVTPGTTTPMCASVGVNTNPATTLANFTVLRQAPVNATYGPTPATVTGGGITNSGVVDNLKSAGSTGTITLTLTKAAAEGGTSTQSFTFETGYKTQWQTRITKTRATMYKTLNRLTQGYDGYLDFSLNTAPTTLVNYWTSKPTNGSGFWGANVYYANAFSNFSTFGPGGTNVYSLVIPAANTAPAGNVAYSTAAGWTSGGGFLSATLLRIPYPCVNATIQQTNSGGSTSTNSYSAISTVQMVNDGIILTGSSATGWAAASTFIGGDTALTNMLTNPPYSKALAAKPTTPSYTAPTAPTDPLDPSVPTFSDPVTNPTATNPPTNYVSPTCLAIKYSGANASNPTFENASWIGARGAWYNSAVSNKILLPNGNAGQMDPTLVPSPLSINSFQPDRWTGMQPPPVSDYTAANFANIGSTAHVFKVQDVASPYAAGGSTCYDTDGYNNDSGVNTAAINPSTGTAAGTPATNGSLWEDTQIPKWRTGAVYKKENTVAQTPASIVFYNGDYYYAIQDATAVATNSPAFPAYWALVPEVWLRIERDPATSTLKFKYAMGSAPAKDTAGDWRWRTVSPAYTRGADDMPAASNPPTTMDISSWTFPSFLAGVAAKAGNSSDLSSSSYLTNPISATFTNLLVHADQLYDYNYWTANSKVATAPGVDTTIRLIDTTTAYMCSQYQVWLGSQEITEDFFSYCRDSNGLMSKADTDRTAIENWFYQPREFWSQSRWWNEGELTATFTATPRSTWIEKETGTVTPLTELQNLTNTSNRHLFSRVTTLSMNMRVIQSYLRNRALSDAAYKWTTNGTALAGNTSTVASVFGGLIYASRTNRYPRNPLVTSATTGSIDNPWNPALPNKTASTIMADLSTAPAVLANRLVAMSASNRGALSAPLRSDQFLQGVMIVEGKDINWGISTSVATVNPRFGDGATTIVTPNALYIKGDLNDVQHTYQVTPTTTAKHYTPLAIMGDSVNLLSNEWTLKNYQVDPGSAPANVIQGATTSGSVITYPHKTMFTPVTPLNRLDGYPVGTASIPGVTSYRTCIVTNNQPTTRYRAFSNESAAFINTMLFMEDWSKYNSVMNFTGSLVVLDTCRYTSAFLLDSSKTDGRTPFGLIGYQRINNTTWNAITGNNAAYDWALQAANGASVPNSSYPQSTASPYGSLSVYNAPSRNLSFNDDLLTEAGTPPNTPFGVTAAGVAGWVRVTQ